MEDGRAYDKLILVGVELADPDGGALLGGDGDGAVGAEVHVRIVDEVGGGGDGDALDDVPVLGGLVEVEEHDDALAGLLAVLAAEALVALAEAEEVGLVALDEGGDAWGEFELWKKGEKKNEPSKPLFSPGKV